MDDRCCRFLEDVVGVGAINSDDPVGVMNGLEADTYDVIALWQVIEHVPDFPRTIAAAARLLAPGGILVLAAPNPDAFQFRLLKGKWTHVDAPRHVALIPTSLLSSLGQKLGLETTLVTTTDAGSLMWNEFGWRFSLPHLSGQRLIRAMLRRIWPMVAKAAAPFEKRELNGSTYVVVLRK